MKKNAYGISQVTSMHYISANQTKLYRHYEIYTHNSVKERTGISIVGDSGPF